MTTPLRRKTAPEGVAVGLPADPTWLSPVLPTSSTNETGSLEDTPPQPSTAAPRRIDRIAASTGEIRPDPYGRQPLQLRDGRIWRKGSRSLV